MERKQYPVLLHSHSHHSSGDFSVEELINHATDFGYEGLVLTDHNTTAGSEEIIEKKLDEKIVFLNGLEWVTGHGHMLVIDPKEFIDYRTLSLDNIDEKIKEVKETEGLVGIPHPFRIGNPVYYGSYWEYDVKEWGNIDFIEIYNRTNPHTRFWSGKAYRLWAEKLNQGYRIAATAGRDWHRMEGKGMTPAVTYVETAETWSPSAFKTALKNGQVYLTLAPRLKVSVKNEEENYSIGEVGSVGKEYQVEVEVLDASIPELKELDIEPKLLGVIENGKVIQKQSLIKEKNLAFSYTASEPGFIRVEITGRYANRENVRLTISSPIYFE